MQDKSKLLNITSSEIVTHYFYINDMCETMCYVLALYHVNNKGTNMTFVNLQLLN